MSRFLRGFLATLAILTIPVSVWADFDVALTIHGDKVARTNVPIAIDLTKLGITTPNLDKSTVTVQDAAKANYPAQIVKHFFVEPSSTSAYGPARIDYSLHVLVGKLPADGKLELTANVKTSIPDPSTKPDATAFSIGEQTAKSSDIRIGDKPLLRFMNAAYDPATKDSLFQTYKVYHHLFDADGTTLLTNGPTGQFPHHRGIFFGFNKVSYGGKSADVWHCTKGAHQAFDGFLQSAGGPLVGQQVASINWVGQDGKPFAKETREVMTYAINGGTMIDFNSTVSTTETKVRLDGDPQHAGFHYRANVEVEKTKGSTYFLRPDGKGKPGQEINWEPAKKAGPKNLPWNAMSFELKSKRYTTVYLDRPENPKEARVSERTYGRFGNYFEYDLTPEKPLRVSYRLWVQPGELTQADCEALSANFVNPPKVEAKLITR